MEMINCVAERGYDSKKCEECIFYKKCTSSNEGMRDNDEKRANK